MSARFLFGTALIVLTILALYPDLVLPEFAPSGRHTDFFYHMLGFLVLATTALAATGRTAFVLISMAILAVMLELLQMFVPGRGVFVIDVIASLLGVGLSWPLFVISTYGYRWWTRTL